MEHNLATTISASAAAACLSLGVLSAALGRSAARRHFRHAAVAGFAATVYCLTNLAFAARLDIPTTIWASRIGVVCGLVHGISWLLFLAGWDGRRVSRFERALIVSSIVACTISVVPNVAVLDTAKERTSVLLGVVYRDPDPGPLCLPVMGLIFVAQVTSAISALRLSRTNAKAIVVGISLGLICLATVVDSLTALYVIDLPVFLDPALACAFLSIGFVVVADAAESAAKSAELERARVALAERENLAAVGQLAAVVAHEVRNPVAVVFGALAMLQRRPQTDDEGKLLAIVAEEAARLEQLVTRLLDAVRPFELQYSRRDASQIVRGAITNVTAGAGVAPSEVELVSAPSEEVECDEILLGQAIGNLVQNALVASGRSSPVRVAARVEQLRPAMLRIEVADDGDGVPLDVRPRLFTPFFTTRATGTGLGLALVKRIAGAHGGMIEYEPRPDRGATFVLRVPIRAGEVSPRRLLGDDVR